MENVVMLEFNELSPTLLNQWMQAGLLPNFKKLHDTSRVWVTESDETEPVNMEPWIQWYSVHTGMPFSEHGVFHLTDGPKQNHEDIWSYVAKHGHKVWNCSSMNARGFNFPGSAFLADPWCTSEAATPPALNTFHSFVSHQVREYSADRGLKLSDVFAFGTFMLSHGLSFKTVQMTLSQLLAEVSDKQVKWKRVAIQDRLLFDVFVWYFKHLKPKFSTFFVNSTAHLQHSYWRYMEPEKFAIQPDPGALSQHKNSVLFGYQSMDNLLGDFIRVLGPHARFVFSTALSQQPYLKYEDKGGLHFYRPKDFPAFLAKQGIKPVAIQPVMTHQFMLTFDNQAELDAAVQKLRPFKMGERGVFDIREGEGFSLYLGSQINTNVPADTQMVVEGGNGRRTVPFFDVFYRIEGLKSGRHHPDGCLWVQSSRPAVSPEKASILDIFPTVVDMLGLPSKMGIRGKVLSV